MAVQPQNAPRFSLSRAVPRDYLTRRKRFRTIFTVIVLALFSILAAAIIVYTSSPSSFQSQ